MTPSAATRAAGHSTRLRLTLDSLLTVPIGSTLAQAEARTSTRRANASRRAPVTCYNRRGPRQGGATMHAFYPLDRALHRVRGVVGGARPRRRLRLLREGPARLYPARSPARLPDRPDPRS